MTDAIKKQWDDLKSKHPDALLLFRCGDFYETYEEDARECARILGITLTFCNGARKQVMAGFPHHALDTYLPKLIRAGKRIAICDQLDPPPTPRVKRGVTETINNNNSNNSKSTTMETKTMKAADLIGKTIKVKDSTNYYVVKSADGETLQTEMHMGERVMPCPMPMTLLNTMLDAGKYIVESEECRVKSEEFATAQEPAASEPTVQEPKSEEPAAKTVTMQPTTKPKSGTRKSQKPQKEPTATETKPEATPETTATRKLKYETYENKHGKTCAKITGFGEGDAMLERGNAERIHASSTYERDKKGNKCYMLIFGPRYAEAAKDVCRAMNQGKTLADCQAIIDQATEERVQRREEWKAKRAAYLAGKDDTGAQAEVKQGYSDADVAAMLKQIMAGGAIPEDIKRAMAA